MLIVSYRAYMGFIGYLCTYIPKRKERKGGGTQTAGEGKGTEERSIK